MFVCVMYSDGGPDLAIFEADSESVVLFENERCRSVVRIVQSSWLPAYKEVSIDVIICHSLAQLFKGGIVDDSRRETRREDA